jgi:hypothetical protein
MPPVASPWAYMHGLYGKICTAATHALESKYHTAQGACCKGSQDVVAMAVWMGTCAAELDTYRKA